MWQQIARDILVHIHRAHCQYRILDTNGRKGAVVAVPMEGNTIDAQTVQFALDKCEHARNALINMKHRRLEFHLRAPDELEEDEEKWFEPELARGLALQGVSDDDMVQITDIAETMTRASTTGIVPRIEAEFTQGNECIMYGCNENCVYSHNTLDLDKSLLKYCFSTQEITYAIKLESTHRNKRKKNN